MVEPAELMRQAEAKEMLADRFDGYVKNLEVLLERIRTGTVGDGPIWTGPAAQRFDDDLVRKRSEVDRLIDQCRSAARNLRQVALRLREQARLPKAPL